MTRELFQEAQEEEFREQQAYQKSLEIATLIQQGIEEAAAVSIILNAYRARADASEHEVIYDENGFPDYIGDGMSLPRIPTDPRARAQVEAIARRIRERYDL